MAVFALLIVAQITRSPVTALIAWAVFVAWRTTEKLIRHEPVDVHWLAHLIWLLLAGGLLVLGLLSLVAEGHERQASDWLIGGGLAIVALVVFVAGYRDLRLWRRQLHDGGTGGPQSRE